MAMIITHHIIGRRALRMNENDSLCFLRAIRVLWPQRIVIVINETNGKMHDIQIDVIETQVL